MDYFNSIKDFIRIFFGLNNPKLYLAFFRFLRSEAVGSSKTKIWYRFNDLAKIFDVAPDSMVVTELGQGSSTFFFLGTKKVKKLFSLEEDENYSLQISNRKLTTVISRVLISKFGEEVGTKYLNGNEYLNLSNFIYLDGPVSHPDRNGVAFPNLDCLDVPLCGKIIAVDCRTNTVRLLATQLRDTHIIFPSKSVISECRKFSLDLTIDVIHSKSHSHKFLKDNLVRTSVFFPKP